MCHPVFAKLKGIWNKYNTSTKFAGKANEFFPKLALVIPTETLWNSKYDSVERILKMRDKDGAALAALFAAASQSPLKPDQFTFLEEWKEVMQHVANGLDFLQGDDEVFLGYMLPTIQMMKEQLEETKEKVTMCKPLADAALRGIKEI